MFKRSRSKIIIRFSILVLFSIFISLLITTSFQDTFGNTHDSRTCFNGRIVEITEGSSTSYGLSTRDGTIYHLDPQNRFPTSQLRAFLQEGGVAVVGTKIKQGTHYTIVVDHVRTYWTMTSRFGLLWMDRLKEGKETGLYVFRGEKPLHADLKTSKDIHKVEQLYREVSEELVSFHDLYHIGETEVILMYSCSGAGYNGVYRLLILFPDGSAKVTDSFGNGGGPEVRWIKDGLILTFKHYRVFTPGETITFQGGKVTRSVHPEPQNPALLAHWMTSTFPEIVLAVKPVSDPFAKSVLFIITRADGKEVHREEIPIKGKKPAELIYNPIGKGNGLFNWKCLVKELVVADGVFRAEYLPGICPRERFNYVLFQPVFTTGFHAYATYQFSFRLSDHNGTLGKYVATFNVSGPNQKKHTVKVHASEKGDAVITFRPGPKSPFPIDGVYRCSWTVQGHKVLEYVFELKKSKEVAEPGYQLIVHE